MKKGKKKVKVPRDWNCVEAIHKTGAGPMKDTKRARSKNACRELIEELDEDYEEEVEALTDGYND